jgi:hypothetical protein
MHARIRRTEFGPTLRRIDDRRFCVQGSTRWIYRDSERAQTLINASGGSGGTISDSQVKWSTSTAMHIVGGNCSWS